MKKVIILFSILASISLLLIIPLDVFAASCSKTVLASKHESWMGELVEAGNTKDGGVYRQYQSATIYCHTNIGAFEVHGDIREKYDELTGVWSFLGYPITNEKVTGSDGKGRYNDFQGGSIYAHPNTGTFEVHGAIRDKWLQHSGVDGFLGYPLSDELPTDDGVGRFNSFQGGAIWWHPDTGAYEVHGTIKTKYKGLGYTDGYLGFPSSDETTMPDYAKGRYNTFQNGIICWTKTLGAWDIHARDSGPSECYRNIVENESFEIYFDKGQYDKEDTATVTVSHAVQNKDPNKIEKIGIKIKSYKISEKSIELIETGKDTGIFSYSFPISDYRSNIINDLVFATYAFQLEHWTNEASAQSLMSKYGAQITTLNPNIKLDTKILELAEADVPSDYAQKKALPFENGKTRLTVTIDSTDTTFQFLTANYDVEYMHGNTVQIEIPVNEILELTEQEGIQNARAPFKLDQHEISEGTSFTNADLVHLHGVTGKGVKIAVIDLAFDLSNPEIKYEQVHIFRKDFGHDAPIIGYGNEAVHGTAVIEIILDIAPDAKIYPYTVGTELEFLNAIDHIIDNEFDIVAMSAGWPSHATHGDSQVTTKFEQAVQSGITTIISAGNYAQTHWEGQYSNFPSSSNPLRINYDTGRTSPILAYLLWDGNADYSMKLIYQNEVVDLSENQQSAGFTDSYEYISYVPLGEYGTYTIEVSSEGTSNSQIEFFAPTEQILNHYVEAGSVAAPTDANGVITVGAVYYGTGQLEPFSSQGPTNEGGSVPSIVGPDCVTTYAYANAYGLGERFCGTSAAAPHVAGIAALLLEKNNRNLTPNQVLAEIQNNADKDSVPLNGEYDNRYGYGLVNAEFITPTQPTPTQPTPTQPTPTQPQSQNEQVVPRDVEIPYWIKSQAEWWVEDAISEREFVDSIEYLIKNEIIVIPESARSEGTVEQSVPDWVKTNARWWTQDLISDSEFATGLQYLIKVGIIIV